MADSTPTTAAGWTRNAIQEINSGEVADARQMLAAALRLDPDYETAWIWFGSIATDDAERRYCYERALAIDPDSVVASQLAQIKTTESRPPAELHDLEAPPLPEEFGGAHYVEPTAKRAIWPLAMIAVVVLTALLSGLWFLWPRSSTKGSPIYVAFVAGLSGSGAGSAEAMERGLQVYLDYANQNSGAGGHPVEVVTFDDEDDPDKAVEIANQIVDDGRFVAVIGHRLSSTSVAAAPIYEAAGIPMISPTATADELTADCTTCYRTVFDNSTQGKMMASYIIGVMGLDEAVVISEESSYGDTLSNGFASAFEQSGGSIVGQYTLPIDPATAGDTIQQTAQDIATNHQGKIVVMAAGATLAQPLLLALRDAGVAGTIFGSDSISSEVFLVAVDQASRDAGGGDVTSGLYASAPVFVDSLNGDSVRLAAKYDEDYGEMPTWRSFTSADAGVAVVNGLRSIEDQRKDHTVAEYRAAILEEWKGLDSPENSLQAFLGPLYFDKNRTASRPVAIGIANDTIYDSAPRQLVPVTLHTRCQRFGTDRRRRRLHLHGQACGAKRSRFQSHPRLEHGVRDVLCRFLRLVQILRR